MFGDDASAPWGADHALGLADIARLVAQVAPDLAGRDVRFLGEGWDYRVFDVGGDILRCPKRAEVGAEMSREADLLALIAGTLPLSVPAARLLAPSEAAPHGLLRHPGLPGVPAASVALSRTQARWVAARAGTFLAALHAFPVDRALRAGVPDAPWEPPARQTRRGLARLAAVARLLPAAIVARCRAILEEPPAAGAGDRCLTHADFFPEHLLVDPVSHELVGVIDWADAEVGDPARDLAGAWLLAGDEGLEAALARYAPARDASLAPRARYFAIVQAIGDAWYGAERSLADIVASSRAALSRA